MLLGSDERFDLMLFGIALLLGFLVDSSVCLAFVLSLVLVGSESLWLELAFVPSHFKWPCVCFFLAFGHLNGFFFCFQIIFCQCTHQGGD